MALIEFKEITFLDFMSFQEAKLSIHSTGLHFIYGEVDGLTADSNGAGKSVLLAEGLAWGLFGETLRGCKADDVVRTNGSGSCAVTIIFKKEDKRYMVTRLRNDPQFGNKVTFVQLADQGQGLFLTGSANRETDEKIVDVLGFSFDLFKNSICHGQGLPYRFTQATDAEKKDVLEEIMALGWLELARTRAREAKTKYKDVELNILGEISGKNTQVKASQDRIFGLEQRLVEVTGKALATAIPTYDSTEDRKQVKKLRLRRDRLQADADTLDEEHLKASEEWNKVSQKVDAAMMEMDRVNIEVAEQKQIISKNEKLVGKPCPTCGRIIEKAVLKDVLFNTKKDYNDLILQQTVAQESHKMLAEVSVQTQEKLESVEQAAALKREHVLKADNELSHLVESVRVKEMEAESAKKAHEEATKEKTEWIEVELLAVKKEVEVAQEGIRNLKGLGECTSNIIQALEFWVEGFSNRGIKSIVLDNVVPYLNAAAARYAALLTDGDIKIEFKTQSTTQAGEVRDKFEVAVQYKDRASYTTASGGEKRRVDVIVLLALHDLIAWQRGVDTNIQIFDEVVESLDSTGTERLVALLKERAKTKGIYIISHDSDLRLEYDTAIRVHKDANGVSYIDAREV